MVLKIEQRKDLLCKAKHKITKEWVVGYYVRARKGYYNHDMIIDENSVMHDIDPATLCRCTGFEDKNKNLLFEHDLLQDPQCEDILTFVHKQEHAGLALYAYNCSQEIKECYVNGCQIVGNSMSNKNTEKSV